MIRRLLCLGAFLLVANVFAEVVPPLVQRAIDELAATREIAAAVTNEEEVVIWQKRIELSEKELENVKQRVALEARDRALMEEQTRLGARHNLREVLRTIETDTTDVENKGRELDRKIRRLQSDRADLASKLENVGETDQEVQQRAESAQKLQNLDTEIRSLILQRDATDMHIRLAQEAARIDQALRARELNPRPTVRQIFAMRRQAAAAGKTVTDAHTMRDMLDKQRQAAAETLALAQERFSHLDQEIETLESLYGTGRRGIFDFGKENPELASRQKQVRQMLADSRGQRRFLQERIEFQKAQVAALDDGLSTIGKGEELLTHESVFLEQEKSDVVHRFLQRITLPCTIFLALIVLNFIIRRLILPLSLKSENLFVARRAVTYVLALVGLAVLTLFFLEDLKSIATILGFAGAAVVIALQDLCSAFAGWFVIITSRKIQVGDRIEVDGHRGDVVDIQMLRTTLLEVGNWLGTDEATGRIVVIPNSFIFKSQFFNYSHVHPYIWGKVDVTLTFESPAKEAEAALLRVLTEETKKEFEDASRTSSGMVDRYGVQDAVYAPRVTSHIGDSGVKFCLYYVCHYRMDDETRAKITRRILLEFEKDHRFRFAYPTQRELHEPSPVSFVKGQHS